MKKFLSLIMSFALAFGLFSNFPIYATEVEVDPQGNEVLYLDQYTFVITEDELIRQVITYDSDTNEEYVSIYNKETNILTDENGNYQGCGYTITPYAVNGPFRTYFDVNPLSAGAIIGAILAVSTFVGAAAAAGVGLEAVKAGLGTFFSVAGGGSLLSQYWPGCSVNGYFEYSQENNFQTGMARNLNRKIASRIGSNNYSYYSYGNGSWFHTSKP